MEGTVQHASERLVQAVHPRVSLVAYTAEPYRIAVSSARTCYAKDFVFLGQLLPTGERARVSLAEALPAHERQLDQIADFHTTPAKRAELVDNLGQLLADEAGVEALRLYADKVEQTQVVDDRIASSIYEAGHHTPFQHPTFVFSLEQVSRNVVESFLHQHTFYNSEQQSQRYVSMGEAAVWIPESIAADDEALAIYGDAVAYAWDAYHDLRARLVASNEKVMSAIGRIKGQSAADIRKEAGKKAQEMARYVIPVAAATQLYHTISGIVLLRYIRMANATNAHPEARAVVQAMVDAVRAVDPDFVDKIQEVAHPHEHLPEWAMAEGAVSSGAAVDLDGHSRLLHATPDAAQRVADVVREVTGSGLANEALLAALLDPGQNRLWNDTLNTWDHSPVLRSLRHVHLTFHKRLSLTAYAQDQRHRMTPATRPLLHRLIGARPDVYTPDIIANDDEASQVYDEAIMALWDAMHKLLARGIPREDVAYLLPNATNQIYTQSGDLLSWIHKWRLRLCFNAQKEIFDASLDELRQAQAEMPALTQWLGPPCTFVAAAQPPEMQDDVGACCPEGPRWCGVKVWKNFDAAKGRPKRPY